MPLRIAFSASVGFESMNEWGWYIFDLAVDVCFLTDIGLTFRTAYEVVAVEGGKNNDIMLVTDGRRIARRYAKVWFPIDLVSSVPFDTIVAAVLAGGLGPSTEVGGGGGGALSFTRLLKLIRLVRLLKLFRVLKLGKLFFRQLGGLAETNDLMDGECAGPHAAFMSAAIDDGCETHAWTTPPDPQRANTFGAVHFVTGNADEIDVHFFDVEWDAAKALNSIAVKEYTAFAAALPDLCDGLDDTDFVVG